MIKPRMLHPGARLAVIAPASPFKAEELTRGLAELQRLGFETLVDDRIFERRAYVSGPEATRAAVIGDALANPSVDALIGARGGYGSVHVLSYLDPEAVMTARKPIIGYSDLTSLLQFTALDCGLVCFHGPTVVGRLSEGPAAYDAASFLGALSCGGKLGEMAPAGLEVLRAGDATGLLLGGTLTQLCASLGTPFAFAPPPGFVLFIDEVNERPYRLDRMLTQLRLAGILARAVAIVLGELPGCDEPDGGVRADDAVLQALDGYPGPVLRGFPSGHTSGAAWTLPLGVAARVVADSSQPAVVILEPAVTET